MTNKTIQRRLKKEKDQLGISKSTARSRLIASILFSLVKECEKDICYQCKTKIETSEELSIEHKIPWLDSEAPIQLYFDLDNIAFSHHSCNSSAKRIPHKGKKNKSKYIMLICSACGIHFERLKSLVNWHRKNRNQDNFYCSNECANNKKKQ